MKSPIFLFSLPRSGSTLLQRVLMTHKDIASVAEPWLMLPFCYAYKEGGVLTEYAHNHCYSAFEDFINNLPDKENNYYEELGAFANILYEKQCLNDEKYFLDKTPRYYNIIPEIVKSFPYAKFIFLFRNPIHVMSSMIQTWSNGNLKNLREYGRDLNHGPKALSDGYKLLKDKAYGIKFEEYVINPEKYTKEICEYLDIIYDENMLSDFATQDTIGRMGDTIGIKEYKTVNTKPLDKWKKTFNTAYRQKLIKDYLQSMEESVLKTQGYNKIEILNEIKSLKVTNRRFIKDMLHNTYSGSVRYINPNTWFGRSNKKWTKDSFLS